jgi:hypothetical protein
MQYKITQLGVGGEYEGFLLIEGDFYCPSIPEVLINATKDWRERSIDDATYHKRLQERWKYRARRKARPNEQGDVRLQCPAAGNSPCARCPLKVASMTSKTRVKLRIHPKVRVEEAPPPCCTQQSITVPITAGTRYRQDRLYGSEEWRSLFQPGRSQNEGFNGYLKDGAFSALGATHRRRVRGRAAQSLIVALGVLASNVRRIESFLHEAAKVASRAAEPKRRRSRRTTEPLGSFRPTPSKVTPSGLPPPRDE